MSKLILWNNGDNSVGIPPSSTEIELCFIIEKDDKEQRDSIAQMFVAIFRDLWDGGHVYHSWDDELIDSFE